MTGDTCKCPFTVVARMRGSRAHAREVAADQNWLKKPYLLFVGRRSQVAGVSRKQVSEQGKRNSFLVTVDGKFY